MPRKTASSANVPLLLIFLLLLASATFYFLRPIIKEDDETETIYCGPNNSLPVKVFKSPTKAFPTFAKDFTSKLNTNLEMVDSINLRPNIRGSGNIELSSKLTELREKLNQESARMEMIMKSNFMAYNSRPCDEQVSKQYFDLLKLMAVKNADLERLRAELTLPASKGGDEIQLVITKDTSQIHSSVTKFLAHYTFSQ
ncbi:MAG TPA: hypothetical protein VGN63_19100 [Flavisolibacter sp.]|jgi:hypothetical protein|nr:hypothetical protein [Flavisolibacter sp.]